MTRDHSLWFRESVSEHLYHELMISGVVYSGQSEYQTIEIVDTLAFGRILVLDGKTQSAESDEFIYHEMLVHPAMITHPGPERVFIAGGGEGATLREVLYHKSVKQAVMVDIDRDVIEASRRYLPAWSDGAFDDPRTTLLHQDAKEYLENTDSTFDVIFIDLSDPVEGNPSALLFTERFYKVVRDRLAPGGIMAIQAETIDFRRSAAFTAICHTLSEVFDKVVPYHAVVPSFSGDWGFATAGSSLDPSTLSETDVDSALATRISKPCRAYDGLTHQGLFMLPRLLREELAAETHVLTEDNLLVVPWSSPTPLARFLGAGYSARPEPGRRVSRAEWAGLLGPIPELHNGP